VADERDPTKGRNDRRYDDREVGLILKRVAELHEREGGPADARAMTRGEIEEVVHELGIPKALVARAVSDVAVRDVRNRPVWWLGGKTDLMFEDVVPGRVSDANFAALVEIARRHFGDPGELRDEGGARIWSTSNTTSRRSHLTVVVGDESTRIRLEERMPMDARTTVGAGSFAGFFAGIMGVIPLKALVLKSTLMLAMGPLMAGGALVGWLGGRAVWGRNSRRRERQLQSLFTEILDRAAKNSAALGSAETDR
jgi:hypothetical protein